MNERWQPQDTMKELELNDYTYTTKERKLSLMGNYLPSVYFYSQFMLTVFRAAILARRGVYDSAKWGQSSNVILNLLEDIGVHIQVTGLEHVRKTELGPCVIVGNHMSFLETMLLPGLILPHPVTFVVKQSLLEYPVFKHVMSSSNPIAVSRTNPRHDLKTVMEEGVKRLEAGFSVVVFPQATRSHIFDRANMGSIGVKLAKKAGVPIVPLALKTDALQNGKFIKDFGAIDRNIPVRLAFDAPLAVSGKGNEELEKVNVFIEQKLQEWTRELAGSTLK